MLRGLGCMPGRRATLGWLTHATSSRSRELATVPARSDGDEAMAAPSASCGFEEVAMTLDDVPELLTIPRERSCVGIGRTAAKQWPTASPGPISCISAAATTTASTLSADTTPRAVDRGRLFEVIALGSGGSNATAAPGPAPSARPSWLRVDRAMARHQAARARSARHGQAWTRGNIPPRAWRPAGVRSRPANQGRRSRRV